jgi:hypothetical protein
MGRKRDRSQSRKGCATLRSDERDAIVRADYVAGVEIEDIVKKLNQLPGKVARACHILDYAQALDVRRPEWWASAHWRARQREKPIAREVDLSGFRVKPIERSRDGWSQLSDGMLMDNEMGSVVAPIRDIKVALEWAQQNSVIGSFEDINFKRITQFGLPPFALER